ncbi:DUF4268 domain-containing protein [Natronococcus sp. JC468]|uniref:DUF4268 domain-containing protein n=1 Tax=Natronococcus sp. JC468 TaxID=1961921 RepID=UPI00143AD15B|nr:DUF4268 domain-containing protein [Natronococcus sp. JC468]NKE37468.1 DUF4268 domain-containing protein [Natronococcus sp. JC468]
MTIERAHRTSPDQIWENELEFTAWLDENIDVLNEELGTSFTVLEREKHTPTGFSIDLVVEDEDERTEGVIECQLGESDHDHLGKLLTYLTAFDSDIAVWIVRTPRYEHKRAVEWLNESSEKEFYIVTIEGIEVSGSTAPLFTQVVGPSPVAREIGEEKRELSERDMMQERFWEQLLEKSNKEFPLFRSISPKHQAWNGKGAGIGGVAYNYYIANNWARVELYIDTASKERNEEIYESLLENRSEIEAEFGGELTWERLDGKRACRIKKRVSDKGLTDEEQWDVTQERMIDAMIRLYNSIKPYVEQI